MSYYCITWYEFIGVVFVCEAGFRHRLVVGPRIHVYQRDLFRNFFKHRAAFVSFVDFERTVLLLSDAYVFTFVIGFFDDITLPQVASIVLVAADSRGKRNEGLIRNKILNCKFIFSFLRLDFLRFFFL
jgi:hypothetical protein